MAVQLAADTVIADRFRLNRLIGRGGMGSVWHATHLGLDIPCAVKFIEGEFAHHPEAQSRFEREAKAAAQLRSPHVVQILDHGVWQGTPYIAMELLDGEDLGKRLALAGRLSAVEVATIITQVCRALTKAHAAGVVHRDLKPDNIFLVRDDDREIAKVLDFGIAKANSTSLDGGNTKTGAMLGTPYYMSPEQAQGIKAVDHRADLWSLAVIVYQCVTGRLPFESEALGDLLVKIIVNPIPVPSKVAPDVSPAFDRWWERAASRDPALRFQTAKELGESLGLVLGLSGLTDVMDRGQVRAAMSSSTGEGGYRTPPNFGATPGYVGARTRASTMPIGATTPHPHSGSRPGQGSPSASGASSLSSSASSPTTGAPIARTYSGVSPSLAPKKRAAVAIAAAAAIVAIAGIGVVAVLVVKGKGDPSAASASAATGLTEPPHAATPTAAIPPPPAPELATTASAAAAETAPPAASATTAAAAASPPSTAHATHGTHAVAAGARVPSPPKPASPPASTAPRPAKPASDLGF